MTLPAERFAAMKRARDFLRDLLDRTKTKRVPLEIRSQARWVLKHYPTDFDLERLREKCPRELGEDEK